ncbi:unnamed protein product [Lampetra planeri]
MPRSGSARRRRLPCARGTYLVLFAAETLNRSRKEQLGARRNNPGSLGGAAEGEAEARLWGPGGTGQRGGESEARDSVNAHSHGAEGAERTHPRDGSCHHNKSALLQPRGFYRGCWLSVERDKAEWARRPLRARNVLRAAFEEPPRPARSQWRRSPRGAAMGSAAPRIATGVTTGVATGGPMGGSTGGPNSTGISGGGSSSKRRRRESKRDHPTN